MTLRQQASQSWGLVSSTNPGWKDVLHVDHWFDAQHVQRQGVLAESELRFDLSLGMSATLVGPGEDRSALIAAAQSPSSMAPAKGTSSSATSTTAKDAWSSPSFQLRTGLELHQHLYDLFHLTQQDRSHWQPEFFTLLFIDSFKIHSYKSQCRYTIWVWT